MLNSIVYLEMGEMITSLGDKISGFTVKLTKIDTSFYIQSLYILTNGLWVWMLVWALNLKALEILVLSLFSTCVNCC